MKAQALALSITLLLTSSAYAQQSKAPASQPATTSQLAVKVTTQPDVTVPTVPGVNPDDIGAIVRGVVDSAKNGKWALLVAFLVMLLTWFVNKLLKQRIPSNVLPWLAIGLATIGAIAVALGTGSDWLNAIVVGLQTGLAAAGSWSALGKYMPGLRKAPAVTPAGTTEEPTTEEPTTPTGDKP